MQFLFETIKELIIAWRQGHSTIRKTIIFAMSFITIALVLYIASKIYYPEYFKDILEGFAAAFGAVAGILAIIVASFQKINEEVKQEKKIEEVEKRIQADPKHTQAAWELARVKLESYLNKNLNQIRSIFWLTVLVMLVGFSLIIYGVIKIYNDPASLNASLISSVSGIIVSFIGATFLILYKTTMAQATDYVNILERINAVGMSVQILETIEEDDSKLKQKTTAEIAKQLLELYSLKK